MSSFALGFLGLALLAVGLYGLALRWLPGSELGSGAVSYFFYAVSGAFLLGVCNS